MKVQVNGTNLTYDNSKQKKKGQNILPQCLAFICSIIWPFCWLYCNQLNLHVSETLFIRSFPYFVVNYALAPSTNTKPLSLYTLMRSVAITVVMFFICVSQFIIPLSIVHMIICSRFVFIFVIDYLINNTQLSPKQLVGMVIAIIGISLACCHELGIMWVGAWSQSQSKFNFYINDDPFIITFFSIAFVGAMALWAYAVVIGKKCRSNFFQMGYVQGITGILMASFLYQCTVQYPQKQPQSQDPTGFINLITNQQKQTAFQLAMGFVWTGIPLLLHEYVMTYVRKVCENHNYIRFFSINSIIIGYILSIFRYKQTTDLFMDLGTLLFIIGFYQLLFNNQNDEDQQDDCFSNFDHVDTQIKYHKNGQPYINDNLSDGSKD